MFFSSEMLSKRGPLAKVWLAAHVERKVSKAQTLQTSIPSTVTVILEPASTMASAPPLALRLSGQLLLGIARIYSKQAKYLLEDCSEASDKIRAAFRSDALQSMADDPTGEDLLLLPPQPNPAARDAINLRSAANRNLFDFELEFGEGFGYGFGDGWEDLNQPTAVNEILPMLGTSRSRIDADIGEITLPDHQPFIFEDRREHGLDGLVQEDIGQIGDTDGFELGLDVGEPESRQIRSFRSPRDMTPVGDERQAADETMEMEVGRDAPGTADRHSARHSLLPDQLGNLSVDKSYDMTSRMEDVSFGIEDGEPAFEPIQHEMNINAGNTVIAPGPEPPLQDPTIEEGQGVADGQNTPRATTPTPNPLLDPVDVTPRTSRRLAPHLTSPAVGTEGVDQQPSKKKIKHQHVDRITELESSDHFSSSFGVGTNQLSTLDPPRFLPKDRYQLQHYRLMLDPSRHEFLPKIKEADGKRWLMAAPAGLCKELQELFKFPANASAIATRANGTKRPRTDEQEEELESEHGRRAQSFGIEGGDYSRIDVGDDTLDLTDNRGNDSAAIFGDDSGFQLEVDQPLAEIDQDLGGPHELTLAIEDPRPEAEQQTDFPLSEPSAPEPRRHREEADSSKLDLFDDSGESQLQSQALESTSEIPGTAPRTKWSKNTLKALSVLKTELKDRSTFELQEVSNKASRRAAAAFFFELLVLSTRDCVKVIQDEPFGKIEVKSQDRLWEVLEQQAV